MRRALSIVIVLGTFLPLARLQAQGCSDAGFCTLNSLKPTGGDSAAPALKNAVKAGGSYGKGDHGVRVWSGYLEIDHSITDAMTLSGKITFASLSGAITTSTGVSDVYLSANQRLANDGSLTVGFKIPLNGADKTLDGASLPMDYQTSLGTADLIVGVGYRWGRTSVQAALQHPLTNNDNGFLTTDHPVGSAYSVIPSTNRFVRRGDILLRVSHGFALNERWSLTAGLLPIYHLADDRYTDAAGVERDITGSKGLTLNGNLFLEYRLNDANSIELQFGAPFITRDTRPDGLTRSFVAGIEYSYSF